jgi:hypothetical protein
VQFSSSNLKLEKVRISVSTCSLEASTFVLQNRAGCADEERICSPSSGYLLPSTTTVSRFEAGDVSVFVGLHNMGHGSACCMGSYWNVVPERGCHAWVRRSYSSFKPLYWPECLFSRAGECIGGKVQRTVITALGKLRFCGLGLPLPTGPNLTS